jgi:hypothetical protein
MATNELKGDYSPMEKVIFKVLRKRESATTDTLLRPVYPRKADEPFNAGIVINRAVTTLSLKLRRNHEVYQITRKKLPKQRLIEHRLERVRERETA